MQDERIALHDRFAGHVHEHIAKTIGQFDTKASIIFGFAIGGGVYAIRELEALQVISAFSSLDLGSALGLFDQLAAFGAMALFLISGFHCFRVLAPRQGGAGKDSLLYFRSVSRHRKPADYSERVRSTPEDALIDAVLQDAYALSRVASAKAWQMRWATRMFSLGVVLLVAAATVRYWN